MRNIQIFPNTAAVQGKDWVEKFTPHAVFTNRLPTTVSGSRSLAVSGGRISEPLVVGAATVVLSPVPGEQPNTHIQPSYIIILSKKSTDVHSCTPLANSNYSQSCLKYPPL